MDGKSKGQAQILNNGNHSRLVQLAVICLAGVSLFTTAQGMTQYIFHNDAVAYAASTAIQGILLAMSMGLPEYLKGVWNNQWHAFWRIVVCVMIVFLTIVTMFCSSWFSYIYIAEIVHFDSWGTESELLVQQTYRAELYNARDYAHIYRTYLETDLGERLLMLEELTDVISENEQLDNLNMDWAQERRDYADTSTTAGIYMAPVIDAMENAMKSDAAQDSREQAARAVTDAQNKVSNRLETLQQELDRIENNITSYNTQINSLERNINNAAAGTDTTGLTNSLNSLIQKLESATTDQNIRQEEYAQLDAAFLRLQVYESRLEMNDASSSISIRNKLLEMQTAFFQDNPDEEKLLATATAIFEDLRNTASYGNDDNFSYTNLLIQMNQLILNLRDYSDIKEVEASLEDLISELRAEETANTVNEESGDDSAEEEKSSEEWKIVWRNRLERLKSQISSMPVYGAENAMSEEGTNILADSQLNTLLSYDRNKSSNQLDDIIRLYIANHNALYQGIIYLKSPYKMLALFSLILAIAFDLSGFILGFISQREEAKGLNEANTNRSTKRADNTAAWSIIPSLNKYKILTGDYEKKDQVYIYQVFEDGLLEEWNVEDSVPYGQGIYVQDKAVNTKGKPLRASEQSILFNNQPGGPRDGVYLNCRLEFEEGSLLLVREVNQIETKTFLVNVNEYVPVHSYSTSKGENQTIPAEQLSSEKIDAQMVVLALNDKGTRIAAIYILEL